jgi:hypothetical protein
LQPQEATEQRREQQAHDDLRDFCDTREISKICL